MVAGLLLAGMMPVPAQDNAPAQTGGRVLRAQPPAGSSALPLLSGTILPTPVQNTQDPAADNGDASMERAYGAFQRGYYLSALHIAEPLANMGDTAAQTLIGEIYLRGLGVPKNEAEAARWYRAAAVAGRPDAQFRYALMLIEGSGGVERNLQEARSLMQKAADAGIPLAAYNYGQMLIQSSPTGGFADAFGYFGQAAKAGVSDAQYALAQLYAFGKGMTPPVADPVAARRWLHAAAVQGHDTAQIELGIWLINGRGGPAAPHEGFLWLKGAAERGNPIAINRLAHLYKDGIGVTRNTAEAAKWTVLARRVKNSDPQLDSFFRSLTEDEQKAALEAANRLRLS